MKKKVKLKPGTLERRKVKAKVMKQLAKAGKESRLKKSKQATNLGGGAASVASKGNNWWEMRSKHGRDKLFTSPQLLWEAACEYFTYTKNNPMHYKTEYKVINGRLKTIQTPLVSVLTMEGLCLYLGCSTSYFRTFEATLADSDVLKQGFLTVLEFIRHTIRNNKFIGAADGTFNATLIAFDLGLRSDQAAVASQGVIINIEKETKTGNALAEVQKKLADLDKGEK